MDMIISGIIITVVTFLFCLIFKINSKISVAVSLLFIAFSAILLILDDVDFANDMATVGYFMLIASVALVVIKNVGDIRRDQSTEDEEEK